MRGDVACGTYVACYLSAAQTLPSQVLDPVVSVSLLEERARVAIRGNSPWRG